MHKDRVICKIHLPMLQARSWEEQHSVVTLMLHLERRIGSISGPAA